MTTDSPPTTQQAPPHIPGQHHWEPRDMHAGNTVVPYQLCIYCEAAAITAADMHLADHAGCPTQVAMFE